MRSNLYVLSFMSGITIILGLLLSLTATLLKERQEFNVAIDIKKNILRSLNISNDTSRKLSAEEIQSLFAEQIKTLAINKTGVEDPNGEHAVFMSSIDGKPAGYAIPISGKGLWSTIYGYLAVDPDGRTIKGITFYRHGETPGLGGEVEKDWFTSNFVGKRIVDNTGTPVSIRIVKGKVNPDDPDAYHKVDGISGATMTTKGVNQFLAEDLKIYEPFFVNIRNESK